MRYARALLALAALAGGSCNHAGSAGSTEQAGPAPASASQPERKVILSYPFDDGKGLGEQFARNWRPLNDAVSTLTVEPPAGTGNASRAALACRLKPAEKLPGWVSNELPVHRTPAEPEGWDGAVSLRIYNGGFESFYVLYLPIWPSDVTFHRAPFEAPVGQWTTIELPMDRFLYHGRRPRRGTVMEYFGLVGQGPRDAQAFFQFDDFTYTETLRPDRPAARPRPALPEGVVYRQDFDDPNDFDLESYYPTTKNANIFRAPGGLDAAGKPVAPDAADGRGCLKLQLFKDADAFRGGRRMKFPARQTVIEFDAMVCDATDFGIVARSETSPQRFRSYARPAPAPGQWTHCVFRADEMVPFGQPSTPEAAATRPAAGETFFELTFHAYPVDARKAFVLIDNLVVRRADEPTPATATAPQGP